MDEALRFKHGIALDSNGLRREISAIAVCIENKKPLEDDQLELIRHVFESLYDFNSLKIKRSSSGRPKGTAAKADMASYVYVAHLKVLNEQMSERAAIIETAALHGIEFKTLEAAYYKEKEVFKHWSEQKQRTQMEAALAWYPLPKK